MRRMHLLLGTGCLFLCSSGWVYNDRVIGADIDSPVQSAVVQAAALGATADQTPAAVDPTALAQAAPAPVAAPAAPATQPSNLNSNVVDVGADGSISQFTVQDMDVNTALHLLSLQSKRNIIASKEVKGNVTVNLYNVSFHEALDAVLSPNGFGYIEKGNFIFAYSAKELEDIKKRDRKTVNRVFHLKYMTAADAMVLVKPVVSSTSQIALTPAAISGLPTGTTDTGGLAYATDDTLVINDYPENLVEVEKILAQIDVRPKQVLVEATILQTTLSENNQLGVDFVSLSGIDFNTLTTAGISGSTGGGVGGGGTGGSTGGTGPGSNNTNIITTPAGLAGQTITQRDGNQVNVGTNPNGGLSLGLLTNNVSVFISALETTTDTVIVANPKILSLNKHHGEVFIGSQAGYITTTQTTTTAQQTVQFLDTGTKLIFRPFITDDGYVRMEIHPEDSSPTFTNNLPGKTSTEVTSNLMVKDGRTVVIGGLFREQTSAGRGQVPFLGNIPVLGIPFRHTTDTTERKEIIVLITPHIINDDTSMYEEAQKKQADISRMMLGNRAGLQPWGRDRLAQTWFSKAHEALDKGNREKAIMYTDWAINTHPAFIEALKLREDLTGKKMMEATDSSIESFVRDTIKGDAGNMPNTGGSGHYPPPPAPTPAK